MASDTKREKRVRDETLICERCNVNFLWSGEEQRQGGRDHAPAYCPGCRILMPAPGRERGVVKWYNPRKKYGFITRQQAGDIFMHQAEFAEIRRLHEGDLVEFSIASGQKGLIAVSVRLLYREAG